MKNLVSKLFGGLAIAAFVFGSFAMTNVQAEPVSINDITIEDINVEAVAVADWYVTCGSGWCIVVKDTAPADDGGE